MVLINGTYSTKSTKGNTQQVYFITDGRSE
jgi:hypothetical protein